MRLLQKKAGGTLRGLNFEYAHQVHRGNFDSGLILHGYTHSFFCKIKNF